MELIERIRAVLDEDERVARAAIEVNDGVAVWGGLPGEIVDVMGPVDIHANRHDPARALRQVAAMRKILDFASVMDEDRYPGSDYLTSVLAEAYGIEPGPDGAVAGTSAQMPHAPARIDAERRKGQP